MGQSDHHGMIAGVFRTVQKQFWSAVDGLANDVIQANSLNFGKKPQRAKLSKTRLLSPEEEVKQLITSATSLEDLWRFFVHRLKSGTDIDFLCFTVLDESGDFIRMKFIHPQTPATPSPADVIISMNDSANHLVQAYQRRDTTFCPHAGLLGEEIEAIYRQTRHSTDENGESGQAAASPELNIFSVPFIAGGKTIALITLGFGEMDAFSQAKLSYIYTLRDQIAQLVWNLVLQDRMKSQAQIDNLTGLLSYSFFQRILESELDKAESKNTSVTVMLLDVNNINRLNNEMGHDAGDEAICYLASTVRRLIRGLDTVARFGGDDVVVVLPETDADTARIIAGRFIEGFHQRLPEHFEDVSISIGYATYPDDTNLKDSTLKLAEQALHLAKFRGGKTGESICIASGEMDQLNEKTVLEVFASHVAKKYNNLHVPSIYRDLLSHLEKKAPAGSTDDLMLETITSLAGALDAKDRYTRGHSQAVANYAVALAHALQMNAKEVEEIRLAAFLHDIGKIGIPEHILCKQGPLTEQEWVVMKQHPVIGAEQILRPVSSLQPIIPAVLHHHENWDGSGHPKGLKAEEIPIGARIISIVDAFHALTSDRAYRKALPVAEAKKILEQGAGSKWDPHLIEVFFKILTIASPKSKQVIKGSPLSSGKIGIDEPPVQLKLTDKTPAN